MGVDREILLKQQHQVTHKYRQEIHQQHQPHLRGHRMTVHQQAAVLNLVPVLLAVLAPVPLLLAAHQAVDLLVVEDIMEVDTNTGTGN